MKTQRSLTVKNVFDKKFSTLELTGVYKEIFGQVEDNGAWLIWGPEKTGKTWLSIILAEYLSYQRKTLFVSAEEGVSLNFRDTCKRVGLDPGNRKLQILEYITIEELDDKLSKRRSARIIILDNVTVYADELKNGVLRELLRKFSDKLFIFLAHEERKEPYTATAKLIRKLAKVIIYIRGFRAEVTGRVPGGVLEIDTQKAKLYKKINNHENGR